MLKSKKAQVIAMTFSNIVQFVFVLFIMIGLVVAGGILFSSKGFSKNSITLEKENLEALRNLENQKILIKFLETPLSDHVKARNKIIAEILDNEGVLKGNTKKEMKKILSDLVEGKDYGFEIDSLNKEILLCSDNYYNYIGGSVGIYKKPGSSVFLFSNKKIEASLDIQRQNE